MLRTYLLSPPKTRLSMYLLVPALLLGASAASLTETAKAASPYVVDGVVLGSAFSGARQYQCRPSEQFAEFAWCQRSRFERARRETFSSSTSVLHGPAGVAYVDREIRPAFFGRKDIPREIERLSEKYGVPTQKLRLPEHENVSDAVIVVWGSLALEPVESIDRTAVQPDPASEQDLTVDHLGDVSESLRRGLPVYRLKGGPGYLWSAASDRSGRGHLRFLALDEPALTAAKERAASQPVQAAPTQELMETAALAARRDGAGFATGKDLRAFLTPQPTSMLQNGPAKAAGSHGKDKQQQSVVGKTRADADRARLADAERIAAEEKEKARVAWARHEAETAAHQTRARLIWIMVASVIILGAILALLRIMARAPEQPAAGGIASAGAKLQVLLNSALQFAHGLRKARLSANKSAA